MYRTVLSARRSVSEVVSVRGPELQFSDRAQTSSDLGTYQPAGTFPGRNRASPELSGYS